VGGADGIQNKSKASSQVGINMAAKYCFGSFLYFVAGSRHTD